MFTGLIKNNKLFYKINESEINLLLTSEETITKAKGEIIYKEGEPGDSIYLIIDGEICIAKERFLGRIKKDSKFANDFFGEESYLEKIPRPFTAFATTECTIVQLGKIKLDQICSVNNQFLNNLKRTPDEGSSVVENISESAFTGEQEIQIQEPVEEIQPPIQEAINIPEESIIIEPAQEVEPVPEPEIETVSEMETFTEVKEVAEDILPVENSEISYPQAGQEGIPEPEAIPETVEQFIPENSEPAQDFSSEFKNDGKDETPQVIEETVSDTSNQIFTEPDINMSETVHINEPEGKTEGTILQPEEIITEEKSVASQSTASVEAETKPKDGLSPEYLDIIFKAAQLVNSNIKIDEVLESITESARNLTCAERATLYLVDKEKNEIWSKVLDGTNLREIRLRIGEGIAGWVVNNKEIVNIQDVQYDHRFNDQIDHKSGFQTKSMLCFPICDKTDEVIGVLQLLNSSKGEFTKIDEEYLKILSIHSALAIENAALVEKKLESERITSLGKMANFLIQDIKRPILISKRFTEHLKSKNLPSDVNQVIDMLLDQLNHVADLVQTTSSFSEGKSILQSIPCQLNESLTDMLAKLESYITIHNCKLVKEFGSNVQVKLDTKEFYQCCMHLIRNACDAMPDGGVINVSTKPNGDSVSIIFKDNGLGIPESIVDKIFDPFMSHGKKEGTGLGLSITKKIVEDHGGTISVESNIGEGAVFTITLPITE